MATVGYRAIDSTLGETWSHAIKTKRLNCLVRPAFFYKIKLAGESFQGDTRCSKSPSPSWPHSHRTCRFAGSVKILFNRGNSFDIEEYQSKTDRLQPIDPRPCEGI